MMCSGFSVRVYMPGRCLTGSRPFNTLIDASLYAAFGFFVDMVARVRRFIVVHSACGQVRGQCVEFSKKAKRNNGVRWDARGAGKLFCRVASGWRARRRRVAALQPGNVTPVRTPGKP